MNRNNPQTRLHQGRDAARNLGRKVATGGALLALGTGSALASGGFDSSTITAKITENQGIAIGIIGAMILAVWALRSMGLLRGRG